MRRNQRVKQKRTVITVAPENHAGLTVISKKSGRKMQYLADEAVRAYIRNYPLSEVQNA